MEIKRIIEYEFFWRISALGIMIAIFINSSRPIVIDEGPLLFPQFDKILHISAWLILSICLRYAFHSYIHNDNEKLNKRLFIVLCVAIIYGVFDEIHQFFVPTRVMDIYDVLADALGAIIGISLAHLFYIKINEVSESC